MRTFLAEYFPIILTFISGAFFWEFARYMFLSDKRERNALAKDGLHSQADERGE